MAKAIRTAAAWLLLGVLYAISFLVGKEGA